jgi:transcription initiation factor IIE alpha subunit
MRKQTELEPELSRLLFSLREKSAVQVRKTRGTSTAIEESLWRQQQTGPWESGHFSLRA